ncbi:hypothetical protein HA49_21900 [Tatumella morbirosei]|uniref:Amidohydrolase-related domain-containing protein n=1 Tax=Tatumella morbirosei TaxID=642227 RepID=A0A0F5BUP6_9GAMM|nr:amidohydrolase family protein [Tatumella morbirosei]KKA63577.1 hypothetical protein HA49_21900 [Tatumella morbirosei]
MQYSTNVTLLKNLRIYSNNSNDCNSLYDIVISGNCISHILPADDSDYLPEITKNAEVIDGKGCLAMPGLINGHFHSPGNFMKGFLDSLPLEIFMLYEVPPVLSESAQQRFIYLRTLLASLEMLKRGITCVHDDAYHIPVASEACADSIFTAYRDAGIRAWVSIDQPNIVEYEKYPFLEQLLPDDIKKVMSEAPIQSDDELMALYQIMFDKWHHQEDGRLRCAVSCSAPQRVTETYLKKLSSFSKEHKIPFNIHVLETRLQRVLGEEKYQKSLIKYLSDLGVLDRYVQIIHAIWVDDQDIELMATSGCSVAHNPVCNLRLGSGIMPFRKLRDAGVNLCLGTDELCSDDTANLWQAAKMTGLIHNITDSDYRKWPSETEILHCLNEGAAYALGEEKLGRIETGALADIVLIDLNNFAFIPLNNLYKQLVYCEDGSSVIGCWVNGQKVYWKGQFPHLDVESLLQEIRHLQSQIDASLATIDHYANQLLPYYHQMYNMAQHYPLTLSRTLNNVY